MLDNSKNHVAMLWIWCELVGSKVAYFIHSMSTTSTECINVLLNTGLFSTNIKHPNGNLSTYFDTTFNRLNSVNFHCFHTAYNNNYIYIKKGY